MNMHKNVIEMVTFTIKKDITTQRLLELSSNFENALKRDVHGFIKRTLTKDIASDYWIELIWWDSIDSARLALDVVTTTTEFEMYCAALVDDGGDNIIYVEQIES
ncbi:Uncharacterised protein [Pragia fontium]|uniref:ABM domain-containing protein n=1 Tax=Pragia fontium TaxID=82985 RepID=A0ABQ5LEF3_9GAMM|nr:hypothetical protein [Pragia fontium]AKJ42236.1 hypothetical protein QQ39_09165 [Pragia fontium]GKX61699.1 hypothetical protein SOASR032_02680 [Pragia fontium]SUB82505.1 Uncharacterised protein [Pragia fontium]